MEIKNKLTLTRGERGGGNGGENGKDHQGTIIKDPRSWVGEKCMVE